MTESPGPTVDGAAAALLESERRYEALFETSAAVQLLVDRDTGAIVRANRAAERFYGWPRVALRSMLITDLDGTSLEDWRALAASSAMGDGACIRRSHRVAAGEARAVDAYPVALQMHGGVVIHLLVHDVSPLARAEASLHAAESHLRTLRERAAATGHDFNNALTVLRGSTEFLHDAIGADARAQEDILAVQRATDRAEALLRGLVELVRRA